jgi:hypothetical protein
MAEKCTAVLTIAGKNIEMNPYVESLVADITIGAVKSLKGVEYIKKVEVSVNRGEVSVLVNGNSVQLTPFPNDIIAATLNGMVSMLKGGDDVKAYVIKVDVK